MERTLRGTRKFAKELVNKLAKDVKVGGRTRWNAVLLGVLLSDESFPDAELTKVIAKVLTEGKFELSEDEKEVIPNSLQELYK